MNNQGKSLRHPTIGAAVLMLGLALGGCAGTYGSIRSDASVGTAFQTAQVLPGHRYYTAGSELIPDAILALRNDRPLRSTLWKEVPMTGELLAKLVGNMRGARSDGPFGSVVLDDKGNQIGVWCSYLRPVPMKILQDGGVIVSPPLGGPADNAVMSGFGVD